MDVPIFPLLRAAVMAGMLVAGVATAEQMGTAFSYQGKLRQGGEQVTGHYDLECRLYDAKENPSNQIGDTVDLNAVDVQEGLFTVQLDFGIGAFDGDERWLEVGVRPADEGGAYAVLAPRQPITPTPYALYALNAPPTAGGLWAQNGDSIYNLNIGKVGIGTASPYFNLDVYDTGGSNTGPTTFGVRWLQPVLPNPVQDWFYFAVGGSALTVGSGTRLIREAGTQFHIQTREGITTGLPVTQVVVDSEGRVGIGTTTLDGMLVVDGDSSHAIRAQTSAIPIYAHRTSTSGTWPAIHAECDSQSANTAAIRAYVMPTNAGPGSAGVRGVNHSTDWDGYGVEGVHDGWGSGVLGKTVNGQGVYGLATGGVGVRGESTSGTGVYGVSDTGYAGDFDGRVRVEVLEITGADLAEKFPVNGNVEPGMVVAIDPENPGRLCVAKGAYNRCVAGVVSGAGGLPTGATLGHLPGCGDAPAIALSGRVWAYCDAGAGGIAPGDLLTTSERPGHAMAVTDHTKAQGAIIGKAMTPLKEGTGMVLVLVSLQ